MARTFDGSSGTANDLSGAANALDDFVTADCTMTAWIKPAGVGENGTGRICVKRDTGVGGGFLWFTEAQSGTTCTLGAQMVNSSDTVYTQTRGAADQFAFNVWTPVVLTYDYTSTKDIHLHANGSQISYSTSPSTPSGTQTAANNGTFVVGNALAFAREFDGAIAWLSFHTGIWNADQIARHGRGEHPRLVDPFNCISFYPLDNSQGGSETCDITGDVLTESNSVGFVRSPGLMTSRKGRHIFLPTAKLQLLNPPSSVTESTITQQTAQVLLPKSRSYQK